MGDHTTCYASLWVRMCPKCTVRPPRPSHDYEELEHLYPHRKTDKYQVSTPALLCVLLLRSRFLCFFKSIVSFHLNGFTALHWASWRRGTLEIAKEIVESAEGEKEKEKLVKAEDDAGNTAKDNALEKGKVEMARYLSKWEM